MSENNCAVYVHVNLINGKKYFGITTQEPEKRWKNGKGYSNNDHFTNAINKYGWNNFAHYMLYRNIPIKIAKNIEEMLIKEHMSYDPRFGYNRTYGGELERHTKETREKISETHKGIFPSEDTRKKMSEAHKGMTHNKKTRQKMSEKRMEYLQNNPGAMSGKNNPFYGKHHNEETRKKLSESMPKKPVEAIIPDTGLCAHRFGSVMSAKKSGFDPSNIVKCCNGKAKTHKGYIWRYVEEVSDDDGDNRG